MRNAAGQLRAFFFYKTAGYLALLCCVLFNVVAAEPAFPTLSGRVVDEAGILSAQSRQIISQLSQQQEQSTSIQLVVVTLKSLQGYPIEDYGYQLGRHWGIGQKDKNNGVLLIVAPNDKQLRIEVGYGLEGELTDAISHDIIQNRILPLFRSGKMEQGVVEGAQAIVKALGGEYEKSPDYTEQISKPVTSSIDKLVPLIIVAAIASMILRAIIGIFATGVVLFFGLAGLIWFVTSSILIALIGALFLTIFLLVGPRGGGFGGGGFGRGGYSGGGFSGGGGSFGGGGASGRW